MSTPSAPPAAYSPRFTAAVARLLRVEGGFVNDPKDRGGATNLGISLRFLAAELRANPALGNFDLDMDGDVDGEDIRRLTPAHARALYHRCFWDRYRCDTLPVPIGEAVFDQAVNGGGVAAARMLQAALNAVAPRLGLALRPLVEDGVIGAATADRCAQIAKASNGAIAAIIRAYRDNVAARYRGIVRNDPSQARFLKGWLRRAAELGRLA